MFYAALDVSLRSVAVCIIDQEGKVRLERSVPSEVPDHQVYYEPLSVSLCHLLLLRPLG